LTSSPAGTICSVQLTVRPGGGGDDGWLRRSKKDGASEALDCEFTVIDGEYAKRKIWMLYTVRGTTPGHAEAAEISRKSLCAMLESARGVRPEDRSEAAQKARQANGWADFDQLRFVARIGVRPPEGAYPAKNTILDVITPNRLTWKQVEQTTADPGKPRASGASGVSATTIPAPATAPPAKGAVTRPQWAR
jgi:hypothetical protein